MGSPPSRSPLTAHLSPRLPASTTATVSRPTIGKGTHLHSTRPPYMPWRRCAASAGCSSREAAGFARQLLCGSMRVVQGLLSSGACCLTAVSRTEDLPCNLVHFESSAASHEPVCRFVHHAATDYMLGKLFAKHIITSHHSATCSARLFLYPHCCLQAEQQLQEEPQQRPATAPVDPSSATTSDPPDLPTTLPDFPQPPPESPPTPPQPPTAGKAEGAPGSVGNVFGSAAMDVDPAVLQPGVDVPVAEPPTRSLSTPEASAGDASGLYQVSSAQVSNSPLPWFIRMPETSWGSGERSPQPSLPLGMSLSGALSGDNSEV